MGIGPRLKAVRKIRGLTQQYVSTAVEVDRSTYAHWERDAAEPDLATVRRLANVLGTSVGYLLGETDDPSPLPISEIDIIRADMPLPPIGWEELSEEEKEEVRQITRRFEETIIADVLRKKGRGTRR